MGEDYTVSGKIKTARTLLKAIEKNVDHAPAAAYGLYDIKKDLQDVCDKLYKIKMDSDRMRVR
jgi:hypothetical protein